MTGHGIYTRTRPRHTLSVARTHVHVSGHGHGGPFDGRNGTYAMTVGMPLA